MLNRFDNKNAIKIRKQIFTEVHRAFPIVWCEIYQWIQIQMPSRILCEISIDRLKFNCSRRFLHFLKYFFQKKNADIVEVCAWCRATVPDHRSIANLLYSFKYVWNSYEWVNLIYINVEHWNVLYSLTIILFAPFSSLFLWFFCVMCGLVFSFVRCTVNLYLPKIKWILLRSGIGLSW